MNGRSEPRATIVDVANASGLSVGTVSNYLNGQKLRKANEIRIEAAIAALNFTRNESAASMKTTRSRLVGMLVPTLSEFHGGLVENISTRLQKQRRALLTICHNREPALMGDALRFFQEQRVCALVIAGHSHLESQLKEFSRDGIPILALTNDSPSIAMHRLVTDGADASRRAVRHLADLGHRRIAVLAGALREATGEERLAGYRRGLQEAGLPIDERLIAAGDFKPGPAYGALSALFEQADKPTAIYSCGGSMTFGALQFLSERGLKIPDDISLVSFDDSNAFRLRERPVTVLSQRRQALAEAVSDLVAACAEAGNPLPLTRQVFSCDLISRESCRSLHR